MFYLAVAAGGALGSVARAWLAIVAARLTGPEFPWGTILVNVIGSFVIGCFGRLTATGTRFAAPATARAFFMVGLCGGFTTFSSFSLQTLDLARAGHVVQAGGNVALSLALCLLAVAAGDKAARAVNAPRPAPASPRAPSGGRVVVVVLDEPGEVGALLRAGTDLLQGGGGGVLRALAIRPPPLAAILPSEEVLAEDGEAALRAGQERRIARLRAAVAAWRTGARPREVEAEWLELEGDAAAIVAEQGRGAEAIVLARPPAHAGGPMQEGLHAALFACAGPVLLLPPGFAGAFGQVIAIAWKDDERAAGAVRAALPLLRRARAVHVLCAGEAATLPPMLAGQGLEAVLHRLDAGAGAVSGRLLGAAHDLGADLLVMGAFAHGEWRERLLGGVTLSLLAQADVPLWLRHGAARRGEAGHPVRDRGAGR